MANLEKMVAVAIGAAVIGGTGCDGDDRQVWNYQCVTGRNRGTNVTVPDINGNGILDREETAYACGSQSESQPRPGDERDGGNGSGNGNTPQPVTVTVPVSCSGNGNYRNGSAPCCRGTRYCGQGDTNARAEINFFNVEAPISPGSGMAGDSRNPRYRSRLTIGRENSELNPKQ